MELPKKLFVVEIELGKPKIKKDMAGDFTKEELEAIARRYNSQPALLAACEIGRSYIKARMSGVPRPILELTSDKEQVDKAIAAAHVGPG